MGNILQPAFRRLLPPPHHYGTDSNMLSEEGNSSVGSLPNELLFEILLLLPPGFLYEKARFVCRKWSQIIRSEDFINAQIRCSSFGLLLASDIHSDPIYVTAAQGRIQTHELSYKFRTNMFDSCNGLVVEIYLNDRRAPCLHVINPATNQQFLLPPVPIIGDGEFFDNECNIAYSAASKEYKVTLPYFGEHDDLAYCAGLLILTIGVDKSWRNVPIRHLSDDLRSLLVDRVWSNEGFFHWVGCRRVLTLNVETENFTYSEIPKSYYGYCGKSSGRNLSVLCKREEFVWEIWEMSPESGEWRNLLPLKVDVRRPLEQWLQQNERLWPLGWVKYPEVFAFWFGREGHTCIFYNLYTHGIDTIQLPATNQSYRASPHRNNLAWLS